MDEIPHDIEVAVRAAADAPRGYPGELQAVYRRVRRRRARRRATAVATAFTVVAGLVGGGFALRQRTEAPPRYEPAVTTTTIQRLLLSGAAGDYVAAEGDPAPVRLGATTQIGELSVDGHLLTHPVVGGGAYTRVIGLPDGRLVSLGPRGSGPGPEMLLTVQSPGGETQQRNVQRDGTPVTLVAADATHAYLLRPEGLYVYDLSDGLERLHIAIEPSDAADLAGDRLITAERSRSCRPLVYDVDALQALRFLPLTSLGCRKVTGLRLSPSTLRAAFTYRKAEGSVWVAILSTEDGTVLANRQVTPAAQTPPATVELAWQTERTVRAVAIPPATKGAQVLRQFTIPS